MANWGKAMQAHQIRNTARQIPLWYSWSGTFSQALSVNAGQRELYLLLTKSFEKRRFVYRNSRHIRGGTQRLQLLQPFCDVRSCAIRQTPLSTAEGGNQSNCDSPMEFVA